MPSGQVSWVALQPLGRWLLLGGGGWRALSRAGPGLFCPNSAKEPADLSPDGLGSVRIKGQLTAAHSPPENKGELKAGSGPSVREGSPQCMTMTHSPSEAGPIPFRKAVFLLPFLPQKPMCSHLPWASRSQDPWQQACLCSVAPPPMRCGTQASGSAATLRHLCLQSHGPLLHGSSGYADGLL